MAWILPEEEIESALRAGLQQLADANGAGTLDALLARIYANLTTAQRASIRTWVTNNQLHIVRGYPHDRQTFPCWAIVLQPSNQSQQYLGDTGVSYIGPGGEHLTETAERWRVTVSIVTYSENGDLSRWLGHLCAWMLSRGRRDLSEHFAYMQQPNLQDLKPERIGDGGGRYVYSRAVSLVVEFDQTDVDLDAVTDIGDVEHEVGVVDEL